MISCLQEVTEAFAFWATPEADLVHPAEAMQQLLEKVRRHRVNIDGNVCTVMVTTLVLEVPSIYFSYIHKIVFPVSSIIHLSFLQLNDEYSHALPSDLSCTLKKNEWWFFY